MKDFFEEFNRRYESGELKPVGTQEFKESPLKLDTASKIIIAIVLMFILFLAATMLFDLDEHEPEAKQVSQELIFLPALDGITYRDELIRRNVDIATIRDKRLADFIIAKRKLCVSSYPGRPVYLRVIHAKPYCDFDGGNHAS